MNIHARTKMDKEAMKALVERGAALCADAEAKLEAARLAVLELQGVPQDAFRLGMVGYLESQRMRNGVIAASGQVADAAERFFAFHRRATDIAIEHGVDVPPPATRDSGGGR